MYTQPQDASLEAEREESPEKMAAEVLCSGLLAVDWEEMSNRWASLIKTEKPTAPLL